MVIESYWLLGVAFPSYLTVCRRVTSGFGAEPVFFFSVFIRLFAPPAWFLIFSSSPAARFWPNCLPMKLFLLFVRSGADIFLSLVAFICSCWRMVLSDASFFACQSCWRSTTDNVAFLRSSLPTTLSGVSRGRPFLRFHSSLPVDVCDVKVVSNTNDCGSFACMLNMYRIFWSPRGRVVASSSNIAWYQEMSRTEGFSSPRLICCAIHSSDPSFLSSATVMSTLSILWVLMKSVDMSLAKRWWLNAAIVKLHSYCADIMAFMTSQSSSETWFWALFDLVDSIFSNVFVLSGACLPFKARKDRDGYGL